MKRSARLFEEMKVGAQGFKIDMNNMTAFITALVFGVSGAFVLYATAAAGGGLSDREAVSWIMSGSVLGGIATILLCLRFRQPIVILPSLPALLVMGTMLSQFSIREMVCGYIIAAILIFLIGAFGIIGKISKVLPLPIIMAMIAGVFMSYGLKMVNGVIHEPFAGGAVVLAFLLAHVLLKKVPPLLIALVVAVVASLIISPNLGGGAAFGFYAPVFLTPSFTPSIILSVSIPLVLLVLADTLKGYGVLRANEYDAPLNTNTMIAGAVSLICAFFLSHAVSMAGPVTAIVAGKDAGKKDKRYVAAALNAVGMGLAGVFAGFVLPFVQSLPAAITGIVAGLAMLGLFTSSLEMAFGSKENVKGAFAAFVVGMSGISAFGIGAPVWAIVVGLVVSLFTERKS